MKHSIRAIAALAAIICASGTAQVEGRESAGAYLAGRAASTQHDFSEAVRYHVRALAADPSNTSLMESLVINYIGLGRVKDALPVAERVVEFDPVNQIANLALAAGSLVDPDVKRTEDEVMLDHLMYRLVSAWVTVEEGRMSEALKQFDEVIALPVLQDFGLYHKSLALALAGDFEGTHEILSGDIGDFWGRSPRSVFVHATALSQLNRNDDALELIRGLPRGGEDARLRLATERLEAGETLPFDFIRNARDGQAEVFHSFAITLQRGDGTENRLALLYSRLAEYLRPGYIDIVLVSTELLEDMGQYGLAIETYGSVAADDPLLHVAEVARAEALHSVGESDAALEALAQLRESNPEVADIHFTLGDLLRRERRFGEAARSYGRAIEIMDAEGTETWLAYYFRGTSWERNGDWDKAEADLRRALKINPDQPNVLNYLGYSMVEMGEKLEEALGMIERAAELSPNSGFIIDSLGWVHYRLGRYDEAVAPMERAAELLPLDPVINDHLGDVFWKVGREREARFQWERALIFAPLEEDEARIRRKLEFGLEVVEDEAASDRE